MEGKSLWVQFHDECPRIGSGWRQVFVKLGHKWCHVRCATSGERVKFTLDVWEGISANARETLIRCSTP